MPTGGSEFTLMQLDGIDFGDYAVRGITMVVAPIPQQDGLMRTINGSLKDVTAPQFHKRSIQISCEDIEAPDFHDLWEGAPVTVTCVPGLGEGITTSAEPDPLVVSCLVDTWQVSRDEWNAVTGWQLNLLEA